MLLGGIIGFDRELSGKAAGFRTNMMVSAAALVITALSRELMSEAMSQNALSALRIDALRIFDVIITGVAFIGAGTIIRDRRGALARFDNCGNTSSHRDDWHLGWLRKILTCGGNTADISHCT